MSFRWTPVPVLTLDLNRAVEKSRSQKGKSGCSDIGVIERERERCGSEDRDWGRARFNSSNYVVIPGIPVVRKPMVTGSQLFHLNLSPCASPILSGLVS